MRTAAVILLLACASVGQGQTTFRPPNPARQPTISRPKPAAPKPPVFDESVDARAAIEAARAEAAADNRRVFVVWGSNANPHSRELETTLAVPDLSKVIAREFVTVRAETGASEQGRKNREAAAGLGIDLSDDEYPMLTILDSAGKPIVSKSGKEFLQDEPRARYRFNDWDLTDFFKANAAPPKDAKAVLDAAIARAKGESKAVFVRFGTTDEPWCVRLDRWARSPEAARLLDKAFVVTKIDPDRMTNGGDTFVSLAGQRPPALPWFAFIGPDGKMVATSQSADGTNMGFPGKDDEIVAFAALLKKVTDRLSEQDIRSLCDSLKSERPAQPPAK